MLSDLVATYGSILVGSIIALECVGLPLPGEAVLLIAAVYAGQSHGLSIWSVILAAAVGGIVGNTVGYLIGRELGTRLLVRYGHHIYLTESRIKIGRYLFSRHGITVVMLARFIAVLRSVAGLLAGANRMARFPFLLATTLSAVIWAGLYGAAAYALGNHIHRLTGPAGVAVAVIALGAIVVGGRALARREKELAAAAEQAFPGPLVR